MSSCTYKFNNASGEEVTITGQAEMKAFLADGGLEQLLPGKVLPWKDDGAKVAEKPVTPSAVTLKGPRRDPTTVSMFNPYQVGDIVMIAGQDWQIQQDMPGWYLTNTGNWRGTHPTIQRIRSMADLIREIERASTEKEAPKNEKPAPAESPKVEAKPDSKPFALSDLDAIQASLRDGTASIEQYQSAWASFKQGQDSFMAELTKKTKPQLLDMVGGYMAYRLKSENKPEIVKAVFEAARNVFGLGRDYGPQSFYMGEYKKYQEAKDKAFAEMVEATTAEDLRKYADEVSAADAESQAKREEVMQAIKDPQTLEDYRTYMRAAVSDGKTEAEARLALTPEQRARMDDLYAEESRKGRMSRPEPAVSAASVTTGGDIVATKHTKTGDDLYVVRPSERVERDQYNIWSATAKRMGGWYSSFRGNGAVPGFQFKTRESADAFLAYIGGDTEGAKQVAQERRDAFADDRSQSSVDRLVEMADRLEERADESLSRDRKANTSRRARMAASAEASANADKAMARTMRNIANAIKDGKAKFLDKVRQKVQVEMLQSFLTDAKYKELTARYPRYADFERNRYEPAGPETADYATFPKYTADRSDLARMGREMELVEGSKKMGQQLLKIADDATDEYLKFVKENLHKVSTFRLKDGSPAIFPSRDDAERAVARSGYRGKAMVFAVKRGQNMIVMGPAMAKESGLWTADNSKRITLTDDAGEEITAKAEAANSKTDRVYVPHQFSWTRDKRRKLKAMGIETAAEFRAALREFITLSTAPERPSKVKELERAMIGRRNDGLDFFPTPAGIAQQMIDAADIKEGMSVLEPSAGMGHIAEQIREAGVDPDVVEFSADRRELLEAKGFNVVANDFMEASGEYDRIVMNPPFSDRRDAQHVQHAYTLLKPGGKLVAIMGEGVFFGQDRKAKEFREWLDSVGGTSEKLPDGSFLDPSLPVNTGVNARMVVIERTEDAPAVLRSDLDDRPSRAGWSESRIDRLIGEFAYDFDSTRTKAYAAFVNPDDFLSATTPKSERDKLESEAKPLDREGLASETQPIYLKVRETDEDGVFKIVGHEGRHRMMALRDAGYSRVPVVLIFPDAVYDASEIEEPYFIAQKFGDGTKAAKGFSARSATPITSGNRAELVEEFSSNASGNNDIRFRNDYPDTQAFREWFGNSKMTNKAGEPLLFMHGSPASFEAFDSSKLGTSSSHASSGLGHFFTRDRSTAEKYADGGNIYTGWLKIEKPYVMMLEEAQAFDDAADSAKRRAELKKQGYDGAVILDDEGKPWATVAFEPWQFKSTDNNGSFDEFDDRMRFRDDPSSMRDAPAVPRDQAEEFIRKFVAEYPGAPQIMLADSFYQLPEDIQSDALEQGSGPTRAKGALKNGKAYVVLNTHTSMADLEASVFHEVLGHAGIRKLLGPAFAQELNKMFIGLGGYSKLYQIMSMRGMGRQFEGYYDAVQRAREKNPEVWTEFLASSILTEEVFAHIAEQKNAKALRDRFMALVGMVRDWLRRNGFARLASMGESDIVFLLQRARAGLKNGSGVIRDGVTIGETVIVDAEGRPVAKKGSPDYEMLKAVSERMGLRETNGPTVFSNSLPEEGDVLDGAPASASSDAPTVFRTVTPEQLNAYAQPRGTVAREAFNNVVSAFKQPSAKVFGALHKTIATQLHKAWVSKDYAKVFGLADSYERDISRFSADPATVAPNLLPSFDSLAAAAGRMIHGNKNAKIMDGVAEAIIAGTLAGEDVTSGRVWTDAELRNQFGLSEQQVGLYKESRAAIDASLDAAASGLAWQMVKNYIPTLKESVRAETGNAETIIDGAMRELEEELREIARFQQTAEREGAVPEGTAAKTIKKAKDVAEARAAAEGIFLRADALKTAGYAPLMRFGKYAVDVVETMPDGTQERLGFYKFETEIEAKFAADALKKKHPEADVSRSVMSEEAWKLYRGVDPELVSLFADKIDGLEGLDVQNEVLQEWYRSAVNDRSAFKRMIQRKGVEGFERDITRVVASFITSNARVAARQFNMGDISKEIADMQARKVSGDVVDEAVKLKEYMENPTEPFQGLKGWMFAWFLGGSVASAALNMTQPLMMTLPYLSQFGGRKAAASLAGATKEAMSGNVSDPELKRALARAAKDGKVDPQQVHHLYHEGMSSFLSKLPLGAGARERAQGFMTLWGYMFGAVENFNRRITFIAAYRMAKNDQSLGNPYDFAVKAIDETQGIYNKANRPNWARGTGPFGAIGVAAFTFKQYSIGYIELLVRMAKSGRNGKLGAAAMLGLLVMLSGIQGFPGADDMEDIIDTVSQHLGYTGNSKLAIRNKLREVLGEEAGNVAMNGVLSLLPFDIGSRVGLGNLLPASAIAKPSEQNRGAQLAELFGPPLSMANQMIDASLAVESGGGAMSVAKVMAPVAFKNLKAAYDMADSGVYRDTRGRKVTDVSLADAMFKAGGFQPMSVSKEQKGARLVEMTGQRIRMVKAAINGMKARAIVENDNDLRQRAEAMRLDWNSKNPEAVIMPDAPSVMRRVKEMNTERRARLMKSLPKEYRRVAEGEMN